MTYTQYIELAKHIFNWPSNPYKVYPNFPGLKKFLGTWKSLSKRLLKEWHPTKNGNLKSTDVTPNSGKKVWWKCKEGHEWEATVNSRSNSRDCPYCYGRYATKENCLATKNPVLAQEWHPTKNGSLKTTDVTPSSGKKVWWQCKKGHEWKAAVANRRNKGRGCPYCANKKVNKENCLATKNPVLAKEWHSTKNGSLKTTDVTPGSDKKVWWECKEGHEWEANIYDRNNGNGCPYCVGQRVNKENCLSTKNPVLAKEWHPTKNGSLKSTDVMPNSNKKFWWKCKGGHEWEATVASRNRGNDCPYCSGNKVNKENCLATKNPVLAKEWHPTKNGSLKSTDVTPGSNKKVWWECKEGHEWEALVSSRNNGNGCPYCVGQRVNKENCLATKNPVLSKEWHPTKNGNLKSTDVTTSSGKKVWWKCKKRGHEWEAPVYSRTQGRDCPCCSGRKATPETCLSTKNPVLAQEWHPTKNGNLKATDVMPNSNKKFWWKCKRGHEWEAPVYRRNMGRDCPYCSGRII